MATRWLDSPCGCIVVYDAWHAEGPVNPVVEHDCGRHGKLEPREHLLAVLSSSRAMGALQGKRAD